MTAKAIDYKVILKRDGQTQQQRMPDMLDPALAPVDPRNTEDLYKYLQEISKQIKFYDLGPGAQDLIENGTWESFFSYSMAELRAMEASNSLPPHLALWMTFANLLKAPQALMNTLTKRHLDFYYHEVLKLQAAGPVPDRAHAIFELKKNTAKTLLKSGTLLLAGKDALKKDLVYKLEQDLVVNPSKVAELKSLFVNPVNRNFIFHAPIANSKDGLGAILDPANPKWSGFGHVNMPLAQVGFCLSSNVLLMKEGTRTVTVNLSLKNLGVAVTNNVLTSNVFKISITGEKGWIGPKLTSASFSTSDHQIYHVKFVFNLSKEEPAVVAYQPETHGSRFDTNHPILQVLLNNEKTDFGYRDLMNAELVDATIEVDVREITSMVLENDFGTLNPKKPFVPFGPLSDQNSNFYIQHEEAFSKRLKAFSFDVNWKNIPASNLNTYYANYNDPSITNSYFTASASFKDGFSWKKTAEPVGLFNAANAQSQTTWSFINPDYVALFPFYILPAISTPYYFNPGQSVQQNVTSKIAYLIPGFSNLQNKLSSVQAGSVTTLQLYKPALQLILNLYKDIRKGQVQIRLNKSFLFKGYREKYTAEILRYSYSGGTLKLPSEPFAPEIQSISLNYTATTAKINFNGTSLNDYIDEEVEFFQYGAFGQAREHAYTRSKHTFLNNTLIKLVPEYHAEGELFIGLTELYAEDSVSMLFQVAEGSANPDQSKIGLIWSVLCDNYWKPLSADDFISDTTNGLLNSGVVKIIIPKEATNSNSLMPDGLLWLKASILKDTDGVCELIDVQSNAGIVLFENKYNDPGHLATALPPNTIVKLQTETAAIKKVTQPYASFGGAVSENDPAFYTRVSERLRHKERSISIWDYERLILQHFPSVHKVKCINHATSKSFYAPGHTLIVVVPDLTNKNAVDPLKPRIDKGTLEEIKTFLSTHSSSWASFEVVNPFYESLRVSVGLRLKQGFEFNYYQKLINQKLKEFLSPWIGNTSKEIHFGGKVTKSMVIKFLEDLAYVDYITSLSLTKTSAQRPVLGRNDLQKSVFGRNVEVAEAGNPASILVSYSQHTITNV